MEEIIDDMEKGQSTETILALINKDLEFIKSNVSSIAKKMEDGYVTKSEFDPIKKIVYGMVGLVLTGIVIAVLSLVIK